MKKSIFFLVSFTALTSIVLANSFINNRNRVLKSIPSGNKKINLYDNDFDHLYYLDGLSSQPVISAEVIEGRFVNVKYLSTEPNLEDKTCMFIKTKIMPISNFEIVKNDELEYSYCQLKNVLNMTPRRRFEMFSEDFVKNDSVILDDMGYKEDVFIE